MPNVSKKIPNSRCSNNESLQFSSIEMQCKFFSFGLIFERFFLQIIAPCADIGRKFGLKKHGSKAKAKKVAKCETSRLNSVLPFYCVIFSFEQNI